MGITRTKVVVNLDSTSRSVLCLSLAEFSYVLFSTTKLQGERGIEGKRRVMIFVLLCLLGFCFAAQRTFYLTGGGLNLILSGSHSVREGGGWEGRG